MPALGFCGLGGCHMLVQWKERTWVLASKVPPRLPGRRGTLGQLPQAGLGG